MTKDQIIKLIRQLRDNWLVVLLVVVLLAISFGAPAWVAWATVFLLFMGWIVRGMIKDD